MNVQCSNFPYSRVNLGAGYFVGKPQELSFLRGSFTLMRNPCSSLIDTGRFLTNSIRTTQYHAPRPVREKADGDAKRAKLLTYSSWWNSRTVQPNNTKTLEYEECNFYSFRQDKNLKNTCACGFRNLHERLSIDCEMVYKCPETSSWAVSVFPSTCCHYQTDDLGN